MDYISGMENGEEIFYSMEKHAFVPVKSCELKLEDIRLTSDAVNNLVNIEGQFNKNIDCGTGLRLCVELDINPSSASWTISLVKNFSDLVSLVHVAVHVKMPPKCRIPILT
jgi:hypothetical protein